MTTIHTYGRFNDETNIGKWGYKITYDDGTIKIDRGSCKTSSSDLMELTAISKAIENFGIYSSFRILVESEKVKQILDRIKNDDKTVFSEKHYYTIRKIHSTIFCKTLIFETEKLQKMIKRNKQTKSKRLEDAKIGECFHFITQSGKEYYLECIELVARTRYDYTEWCVSEQTYEVYVPRFKNQYGKVVCLQGNAELITKEEYEINLTHQ